MWFVARFSAYPQQNYTMVNKTKIPGQKYKMYNIECFSDPSSIFTHRSQTHFSPSAANAVWCFFQSLHFFYLVSLLIFIQKITQLTKSCLMVLFLFFHFSTNAHIANLLQRTQRTRTNLRFFSFCFFGGSEWKSIAKLCKKSIEFYLLSKSVNVERMHSNQAARSIFFFLCLTASNGSVCRLRMAFPSCGAQLAAFFGVWTFIEMQKCDSFFSIVFIFLRF